jgi:uncharacterized protein (DUF302 family)
VAQTTAPVFNPFAPPQAQPQAQLGANMYTPRSVVGSSVTNSKASEKKPELGPRLLKDLPEAEREARRKEMVETSYRVPPAVAPEARKFMFSSMAAMSPMSVRDFFNLMSYKKKAKPGLSVDDVIQAMDLKANSVNLKKTGHSEIWKDVGANSGLPTTRVDVLLYCDAIVGRKMLEYSPDFINWIPCRVSVYEDPNGEIWVMMMDWDITWLDNSFHPENKFDKELRDGAIRVRKQMEDIINAGVNGEW